MKITPTHEALEAITSIARSFLALSDALEKATDAAQDLTGAIDKLVPEIFEGMPPTPCRVCGEWKPLEAGTFEGDAALGKERDWICWGCDVEQRKAE